MNNVRKYTDIELIESVEKLPTFKGWGKGVYDIWVRSIEDEFDVFDDKVYTFECLKDGERPMFKMVCTGTSNAGSEGLLHYDKYNALGCAVLKSNTIIYHSHGYGKHKGKYNAYVQVKGFPYFRDGNKNKKAEEIGNEYINIIGANCHKAGVHSNTIGGWSVACLVRNDEKEYNKWLDFMNKRPLNVVILKET